MNKTIKDFQNRIKTISDPIKKESEIMRLKNYVCTLPETDQVEYRNETINNIEQKFSTIDKLIDAYQALRVNKLTMAE